LDPHTSIIKTLLCVITTHLLHRNLQKYSTLRFEITNTVSLEPTPYQ